MSETTDTTFGEYLKRQAEKTFRRSDSIAALAAALSKAQGEIESAKRESSNPYFKSHYADLASVWDVIRQPFSEAGLAVMQFPRSTRIPRPVKPPTDDDEDQEDSGLVEVETVLAHSSGEWVSETLAMPVAKYTAHGVGAAITYGRRYALISFAGVSAEDDDGNGATDQQKLTAANSLRNSTLAALTTIAQQGTAALADAWNKLTKEARKACQADLPSLKARAAKANPGSEPPTETPNPSDARQELQKTVAAAGCAWTHFAQWLVESGNFEEAGEPAGFGAVKEESAARFLRASKRLLQDLNRIKNAGLKEEVL